VSVLELYLLVAMHRLEGKDRDVYNFNTIFKGQFQSVSMLLLDFLREKVPFVTPTMPMYPNPCWHISFLSRRKCMDAFHLS
jgi:hypothetical protein